jgi:Flp pilus assembly secretin CpaC
MRRPSLPVVLISLGVFLCSIQDAQAKEKQAQSEAKLITVIYSVADLVVPIPYHLAQPAAKPTTAAGAPGRYQSEQNPSDQNAGATQEQALIDLIHTVVAPDSWQIVGGRGSIRYVSPGMGLAIQQTKQAHEEIAAVLKVLRRLQDVEVAVEIRMVSLSDGVKSSALDNVESRSKMAFLSDIERASLLEAIQADKRSEMLQAPKVTLFNGQRGSIQVCDYQFFLTGVKTTQDANGQTFVTPINEPNEIGVRATVCPTVSADRRHVFLDLQMKRTTLTEPVALVPVQVPIPQVKANGQIDSSVPLQILQMFLQQPQINTQALDQKFSVPDGGTALIVVGKGLDQTKTESSVPVLGDLPYVGDLFRTVSYGQESRTMILLVTPRIIINAEQE